MCPKLLSLLLILAISGKLAAARTLKKAKSVQARDFSDCATTEFRIRNSRMYTGGAVYKYTKLNEGQGAADCRDLCNNSEDCWSFNYNKVKRYCYLQTDDNEELESKRSYKWSSGFRVCIDHSETDDFWANEAVDSSTLSVSGLTISRSGGTFQASWTAATGLSSKSTPSYVLKCGPNASNFSCNTYNIPTLNLYTSPAQSSLTFGPSNDAFAALAGQTSVKCYVETYISNLKTACSDAATDLLAP